MTVTQLAMDGHGARLYEITFARIYSPSEVSCLRMWKGVCTFLINSEVKVLKYDPYIQPVHNVHKKAHIKFSWKDLSRDAMNCQIYRDDIIIGLCKPAGVKTSADCSQFELQQTMATLCAISFSNSSF